MLKVRSQGATHQILEVKDLKEGKLWTRDNADGKIPFPQVSIYRIENRVAWLHVSCKSAKALTANSPVWIGSISGDYRPMFNVYNYPVHSGWIDIFPDPNSNDGEYRIEFTPNANIGVGGNVRIDLMYIA